MKCYNLSKVSASVATIAAMAFATPASAAEFMFNFDGAFSASGTITTEDTDDGSGGFLITGITGTVAGESIFDLYSPPEYFGNDNLLFVGQDPLLSFNGFSFFSPTFDVNIYYSTAGGTYNGIIENFFTGEFSLEPGTFTIAPVSNGAVPEPSTWAMLLIGFAAVGGALRTRRKAAVSVSYS